MSPPDRLLALAAGAAVLVGAGLLVVSLVAFATAPERAVAAPPPRPTPTAAPTIVLRAVALPSTTTITTTTPTSSPPGAPTPPPTTAPAPSPAERVVAFARAQLGKPYRFAAAGPAAFDCSGLTAAAYAAVGVALPHYSVSQAGRGRPVNWRAEPIRPGDLVFMRGGNPVIDLGHVGLAASATEWIVAPRAGASVRIERIPLASVQRVRRYLPG